MSSTEPSQPADRVPTPLPVRIRRARPRWPLFVATIGLAAVAGGAVSVVRQPVQFSADMVSSTSGTYGGVPMDSTTTGTYYAKGPHLTRAEFVHGSQRTITIHHGDEFWHLDPATKTYYRMFDFTPEQKARFDSASRRLDELSTRKEFRERGLVGTEVVNGYLCEKRVGEFGGTSTTMWIAPKLHRLALKQKIVMRSQVAGVEYTATSRQEYRNIREHRLPSSLFEIPKDYRKIPPPGPKYDQSGQSAER